MEGFDGSMEKLGRWGSRWIMEYLLTTANLNKSHLNFEIPTVSIVQNLVTSGCKIRFQEPSIDRLGPCQDTNSDNPESRFLSLNS
jgi:hypothetical protein